VGGNEGVIHRPPQVRKREQNCSYYPRGLYKFATKGGRGKSPTRQSWRESHLLTHKHVEGIHHIHGSKKGFCRTREKKALIRHWAVGGQKAARGIGHVHYSMKGEKSLLTYSQVGEGIAASKGVPDQNHFSLQTPLSYQERSSFP